MAEDPRPARLSEICLGLDNHRGDQGIVGLACKAPPGENTARAGEEPDRFYVPAYVGPRGWIGFRLDMADVDWDEAEALVVRAYLMTAPKRLAAELQGGQTP